MADAGAVTDGVVETVVTGAVVGVIDGVRDGVVTDGVVGTVVGVIDGVGDGACIEKPTSAGEWSEAPNWLVV